MARIAGANNDINVLDNYPLFDDLLDDLAPVVSYVVNGIEYCNGVKKVHGKMSNVLSVFSKDAGDLFNNRLMHAKSTHYVESLAISSLSKVVKTYSVVELIKEVRDELYDMPPQRWKQDTIA
nr:hypothetical protein [Tanacetum cinerariifolium]